MSILIKILKTAGKLILLFIAVILIILIALLVCPIYYEVKGEKYESVGISARIRVLFGLVSVRLGFENGELSTVIKLFGKELFGKKDEEESEDEVTDKKEEKNTEEKKENNPDTAVKEKPKKKTVKSCEMKKEVKTVVKPEENKKAEEIKETKSAKEEHQPEWNNEKAEKTDATVRIIKFSEIKKTEGKPEKVIVPKEVRRIKMSESEKQNEETDENEKKEAETLNAQYFINMPMEDKKAILNAFIQLLKSVLKSVKPTDFYLKGSIGLSDPALTGKIVGLGWALNGILGKQIELQALFNEEKTEGEVYVKGHIVPILLLYYILRLLKVRAIRKIIILFIKGDKNGK